MNYEQEVKDLLMDDGLLHLLSGLSAECGEVNGLFQKSIYLSYNDINKEDLLSELGDVMYYLTALSNKYGFSLEDVQKYNIDKLRKRHGK